MWWKNFVIVLSLISLASAGPKKFHKDFLETDEIFNTATNFDEPLTFRLPNNTIPLHYDVTLLSDIHIPNFDFFGTVIIHIRAVETSQNIVMHYRQSIVSNVDLLSENGTLIEPNVYFTQRDDFEFLTIQPLVDLIQDQEYRVRINYRATLRSSQEGYGFYRANYVNEAGQTRWLATTQFQSTDARHAFPCYDEPHIRTSFTIRIRHHETYRALSNMPVESITRGPIRGFVITEFQRVRSMQTYLVAFTVSDYIYAEDASVVPPQRIYAKPASIHNHEYELALEASPKILLECEKFFEMNYTFPKMDQIAITQFSAGAMENWGLVSYREVLLLFDPLISTTRNRHNILTIISHEFVHQWLGNMVVMQWWSYLWLNEGFANLYEYYITHFTFPEERFDDSYLIEQMQTVLVVDANPNIRPMTYYVEDHNLINYLFDWVAYNKAGSVLHTFMFAFGLETWRNGVNYYLRARYDNYANPDHLYENLQRAVNEDYPISTPNVATLMRTWELQSGFPLVTVRKNGDSLSITQERFFYTDETSANLWYIPINYVTASYPDYSDTTFDFFMNSRNVAINNITAPRQWQADDWIIFNIKQNYYYRVNYDQNLWNAIIKQLNDDTNGGYEKIHYRNRAQLIDDSYNLAQAGKIDYGVLFGITDYLWQETDFVPWAPANRAFTVLNRWLSGSSIYPEYQAFIRKNVAALFLRLGVEFFLDEPRLDRFARTFAVTLACRAQLPECLASTAAELEAYVREGKRIAPEYVNLIYCNGLRTSSAFIFLNLQNRIFQNTSQTERNNIITALGCTQSKDLLFTYLNLAILPGISLSVAEKTRILTAAAPNGEQALKVMIEFTNENYAQIVQISGTVINSILTNIASNIASEDLLLDYEVMIGTLVNNEVITVLQGITFSESARVNLIWQAANIQPIIDFFELRR